MRDRGEGEPIAILAGRGSLPPLVAAAAVRHGRAPVVFAIYGEADDTKFGSLPVHVMRWGELGRLFRLAQDAGCREAVFIGAIANRPDLASLVPDMGAVKLIPRILKILRAGDDGALSAAAAIFEERGLKLINALDLAPELALEPGLVTGRASREAMADIAKAAEAARLIGRLDIGQAAVAVGGRVVALEDAGGTDVLLERIPGLRQANRIAKSGGVLVKCVKPNQDVRIDLPTIGPETAERARAAGLEGVAADAGSTLLAGPAETLAAFRRVGIFLLGLTPETANG
jgi:DUF1009 family protein